MSAFICNHDHFKALAIFASSRIGCGYGSSHMAVDPRYVKGLPQPDNTLTQSVLASLYANTLYNENVRSVQSRYPDSARNDLPGPIVDPGHVDVSNRDVCNPAYKLKPVDILGMCNCLEYQSCESDDWETTIAFSLLNNIRKAAVQCLPDYDNAPWDFSIKTLKAA